MSKERELAFTIAEQWGNAACNKEQLIKDYGKEQAIAFAEWLVAHFDVNEFDEQPTYAGIMNGITKEDWTTAELYQLFLEQ